ncbi:hypothetical protein CMI48_00015 [Candidatus Pacearchaeota archaeon]|nr:hypothetical protein [Candidatus Pacearchaeota archaeon]
MNEHQTYDIYYDKEGDFLEASFGEPPEQEGTTEEIEEGVFVTRETGTNEVKSVGILSFRKRMDLLKQVMKQLRLEFPLSVSVE